MPCKKFSIGVGALTVEATGAGVPEAAIGAGDPAAAGVAVGVGITAGVAIIAGVRATS
jgi:hypothetical protein